MKRLALILIAAIAGCVVFAFVYQSVMQSRHAADNIKDSFSKSNAQVQRHNDELQVENDKLDIDIAKLKHEPKKVKEAQAKLAADQSIVTTDKLIELSTN